jgi:hypothetical protein
VNAASDTRKLLLARTNADLASLAGFVHQRRHDISKAFVANPGSVQQRYNALAKVAARARAEGSIDYTLPRVLRIFGI